MGFSGLFTKSKKYGLLKAYIVAILARVRSMRSADIYTGWIICRIIFRSL